MRRLVPGLALLAAALIIVIGGYVAFIVTDAMTAGRQVQEYRNPTGAMEPTLLAGETFTVVSVRSEKGELTALGVGDVVTHQWPPDRSKVFVKRIVGVPGDTLEMRGGVLRRNRHDVVEPYAWHAEPDVDPASDDFNWQRQYLVSGTARDSESYHPSRNTWGPLVIPPGQYFVLGDNRDNSLDSRYWGFLPADDILGRARRVYMSRDPATGAIRWKRFGVAID